jgi:serine phosphatase RsbU (regulator of sigma subunit)
MRIRSMMCVPLVSQDESGLGVIQIVSRDQRHSFTEEDLDLLVTVASQASMAIENARFHEDDVERRELERDLEFATQVQLGFLPKSRPKIPGYEFADYYEAALRVGGDYFDYITLPDGRVAVAIGDVAGKGMPAALLMARLYSSTRFQLLTKPTLEQAVAGLNEEISSSGLGHRFITLLVMVINPRSHELSIVNAGHLTAVLRHVDGTIKQVGKEKSSLPLGIVPEMTYESMQYQIAPGDSIVGFTDGVTESMNDNREIFGRAKLDAIIAGSSGNADAVLEAIVDAVEEFTGPSAARDDTCIIAFRRLSPPDGDSP